MRKGQNYNRHCARSVNINMCAELVTLFARPSFLLYFSRVILVANKSFTAVFKMRKRDLYVAHVCGVSMRQSHCCESHPESASGTSVLEIL